MSYADWLIMFATSGYFGAAGLYLMEGSYAKFSVFAMYGACNIIIALWVK